MQAFPVKITSPPANGVAHVIEYRSYDYRWGKPRQSVDANGNVIDYTFDDLGRLLQADLPDGGQMRREYYDEVLPRRVVTFIKETVDSSVTVQDLYDGLGRKTETITIGAPDAVSKTAVRAEAFFDQMGRNYLNVGPYFHERGEARPESRTFFDHLDRPVRIEQLDPEHGILYTYFTYAGFNTTLTDPDGASKTEVKDYLGRITRVIEHADAGDQHTDYAYNAAGELRTVTNHLNHVTTLNYDTLGRKTAMDDPDMGAWSYTYDANGNLKTQTDSKSQVITFDYDALDRLVAKSYSSGDAPVSYTYDETGITNGIGRLYEVDKGGVSTTITGYDAMGRNLGEIQTIPGRAPATTMYEYDFSGKLLSVDYPNWLTVYYHHISETGLLEAITINSANNNVVADFINYRPSGKLVTMKRGQITTGENYYYLTDTFDYHPLSDRLEKITTQRAGDTGYLQNREYDYTPAGDIAQIRDLARNRTYTYTYDKLHRLKSETATGVFAYKPDSEFVYTYNGADQPHAVATIAVNGNPAADFVYDDNGNMTDGPDLTDPESDMLRQLTWDADNMPLTVGHSQYGTTAFLYDGNGRRVKKTAPGGSTTYYVNRYYEVIGGEAVCYIWAGNQRIARFTESDGMQFYIKDHLGSSSLMTDNEGAQLESTDYFPFGGQRDHSGSVVTNYKFTDQEHDPETGLYNYDARLYDPLVGNFISPDPKIPDVIAAGAKHLHDPQMFNRYAYVRNNPLNAIDPDGYEVMDSETAWVMAGNTPQDYVNQKVDEKAIPILTETLVIIGTGGGAAEALLIRNGIKQLYKAGSKKVLQIIQGLGRKSASKSGLKPGTLSNEATRKWYHSQLDSIPSKIDSNLPLKERALQAFKMRNEVKLQARDLMADRAAAEALPAPKTLQDVVRKAYQQGLLGDDVWHYVLGGSQRSNAAVDSALGLTR